MVACQTELRRFCFESGVCDVWIQAKPEDMHAHVFETKWYRHGAMQCVVVCTWRGKSIVTVYVSNTKRKWRGFKYNWKNGTEYIGFNAEKKTLAISESQHPSLNRT
jgi:hypothetical protein